MRIAITKQPITVRQASYAQLASNITSAGVWFGDEHDKKAEATHTLLGKQKQPAFDA